MSGNSKGEPSAKLTNLKPSAEVQAKMKPISREAFHGLIRRSVTQPLPKPAPTKK